MLLKSLNFILKSIKQILKLINFFYKIKPFKKERGGSGTSGSAFGSGIFSFSVKSLIGKRKKSAPEQELKRVVYDDDNTDYIPSEYLPKMSQVHLSSNSALNSYYIYLNESCCVEVNATQQASTVQNLLAQVQLEKKNS